MIWAHPLDITRTLNAGCAVGRNNDQIMPSMSRGLTSDGRKAYEAIFTAKGSTVIEAYGIRITGIFCLLSDIIKCSVATTHILNEAARTFGSSSGRECGRSCAVGSPLFTRLWSLWSRAQPS